MRKHFLSVITIFLLFCLTACSGLIDEYSSVSVTFPEGTSNQLTAMRAAANTSSFTCTLKTEGDYETTASKTYANLDEINNATFEVKGIPVNKTVTVKLQLSLDGTVYYEGTSNQITVKKGNNDVNVSLKAVAGTVDVGFDLLNGFEIYASILGENNFIYKEKIPSTTLGYIFAPMQNGIQIESENITWSINGRDIKSLLGDFADTATKDGILVFPYTIFENIGSPFSIQCTIIDGDKTASKTTTFEVVYSLPSIGSTGINTDFVLHVVSDYDNNHIYFQNLDGIDSGSTFKAFNYILRNNGGYYYSKNYNSSIFSSENNDVEILTANNSNIYKYNSDLMNNNISYLVKEYEMLQIKALNTSDTTTKFITSPLENADENNISNIATSGNNFAYSYTTQYPDDTVILINNTKSINLSNYIKNYSSYITVKDMLFLKDYLLILIGNCSETSIKDNESVYMNGALMVIDIYDTKNVQIFGNNEDSYDVVTYKTGSEQIRNKRTVVKMYSNRDISSNKFFVPTRFIAIKDDELYIADTGHIYEDAEENDVARKTDVNRIVSVNLRDFSITPKKILDFKLDERTFSSFN